MGFITSITRSMCGNNLSKKHSPPIVNREDEDSTDLITKPCRATTTSFSHTRDESFGSASTAVQRSSDDEILPVDSPTKQKQLSLPDLNLQPLLDNGHALDAEKEGAVSPFTRKSEYPVLKVDTMSSPSETPDKKLASPIDASENTSPNEEILRNRENPWDENGGKDRIPKRSGSSKLKRSMTLFRRKYSLKVNSRRNGRGSPAPSWFDACSLAEEACLVDEKEEKWLEAHGIRGGRDIGHWSGDTMERAW